MPLLCSALALPVPPHASVRAVDYARCTSSLNSAPSDKLLKKRRGETERAPVRRCARCSVHRARSTTGAWTRISRSR